jgi:hypothetical protein
MAALIGANPQDFANAIYPPGSKTPCTVVYRVVQAGTLEPVTAPIQVAVDLKVTTEPTPSYVFGVGESGHATFAGGAIHEIFSPTHNGVFRITNAPSQFELVTDFGTAGSSDANIYLQCFAPETVLLLVIKNPCKISDGAESIWVKSGKYATVPH